MARLIDADEYVDELKWLQTNVSSESAIEIQEYIDRVNKQPTVNAVEVVRCKDCKFYNEDSLWCGTNCCVGDNHANWYPDDFCSYGERRTDG